MRYQVDGQKNNSEFSKQVNGQEPSPTMAFIRVIISYIISKFSVCITNRKFHASVDLYYFSYISTTCPKH